MQRYVTFLFLVRRFDHSPVPSAEFHELVFHIAAPPRSALTTAPRLDIIPLLSVTLREPSAGNVNVPIQLSTWGPHPRDRRPFLSRPPISTSQLVIIARTTKVQTGAISRHSVRSVIKFFHKKINAPIPRQTAAVKS
ncbi:hypothetical protein AVEN_150704-1 [Araneus ventricosus]|uniref:Uncharacterized protein n=1 Tax=Araneus ventricosus TaxID=182803 RepID=A0A4Y2PD73_ARAVE|nr:hypothetical protein AVEN_150704-1 [Araneus ventricosus]